MRHETVITETDEIRLVMKWLTVMSSDLVSQFHQVLQVLGKSLRWSFFPSASKRPIPTTLRRHQRNRRSLIVSLDIGALD